MTDVTYVTGTPKLPAETLEAIEKIHADYLIEMGFIPAGTKPSITAETLLRGNKVGLVLDSVGKIIGYCLYRNIRDALKIRCLYTVQAYRRTKVATKLLKNIFDGEEFTTVTAESTKKADAKHFFESLNFDRDLYMHDSDWARYTRTA